MVGVGEEAAPVDVARLVDAGCGVYRCEGETNEERLRSLLAELGRRDMTNVLVEGGSRLLANLHRIGCIDEVHAFIAPKVVGETAAAPMSGAPMSENDPREASGHVAGMADVGQLRDVIVRQVGCDVQVHGRSRRPS